MSTVTPSEATGVEARVAINGALEPIGHYRWTICALLFFATTINYIDRQVLGILAPTLQREIGWSEAQYGAIVSWFSLAYAFGFLGAGRLMDRIGARRGFALAIVIWSVSAFAVGKFMTDPIWWFYLYWLPKFLDARYGIKLAQVALPLIAIYVMADVGSVFGGWLSGALIKRGWSVNAGRKTTMLVAALLIVPTMFAPAATHLWLAVGIVGVAGAAPQ